MEIIAVENTRGRNHRINQQVSTDISYLKSVLDLVILRIDYLSYYRLRLVSKSAYNLPDIWGYLETLDIPLYDKLIAVQYHYRFTPQQGSIEWLKNRTYNGKRVPKVGGSELAQVLGLNKYSDDIDLMYSKLGIIRNNGDINTHWGNLFEDVLFGVIRSEISAQLLFETGSIPGMFAQGRVLQDYSPDGIGLCKQADFMRTLEKFNGVPLWTKEFLTGLSEKRSGSEDICVLFEGKSPLRRTPTGKIPEHYQPQPKIGLTTIPIADIGVFTEGVFRLCGKTDFSFNSEYNRIFHKEKPITKDPLYLGIIGIYQRTPNTGVTIRDLPNFSVADVSQITEIFAKINAERYSTDAASIYVGHIAHTNDESTVGLWLRQQADVIRSAKDKPIGYMMWKMFQLTFIPVQKDMEYREECRPKLIAFTDKLKYIIENIPVDKRQDYITQIRITEEEKIIDSGVGTWNFQAIVSKFKYRGAIIL